MPMSKLKQICEDLGYRNVKTYVQSGNLVFSTSERSMAKLAKKIEDALEKSFGFRPDVINRTAAEMRDVVDRNPFAGRTEIEPSRLLVTFLASDPGDEARQKVRDIPIQPEELHIDGREMSIYYPAGIGRSKLPAAAIGRALKVPGTARNWNTVTKLLEMAESL